jgi:hypothetical protein
MTIGNVIQKSFESNGKAVKYIEMIIRPPFMQSATFTITENKKFYHILKKVFKRVQN